jgi:2-iminobutanoate/2-iminopropanoate deaminase
MQERQAITTSAAPKAVGPYSQGVALNGTVYLSGQIPLDPATGELVTGDIAAQAARVLENLKAVLEAAGSSFERVLKTTVYLRTMDDFAKMNEVYARYFPGVPPARTTIAVVGLPKGAQIEIDLIAAAG